MSRFQIDLNFKGKIDERGIFVSYIGNSRISNVKFELGASHVVFFFPILLSDNWV